MNTINEKTKHSKKNYNIAISIFLILLWLLCIYFGYNYIKNYIDVKINSSIEKLENVKNINSNKFNEVNKTILALNSEIINLKDIIADVNDEIEDVEDELEDLEDLEKENSDLKDDLNNKLNTLSNQMEILENNLKILQEAPNVKK